MYNVVTVLRYGDYLLRGLIVKSLALGSRPSASRAGGRGVRTDTRAIKLTFACARECSPHSTPEPSKQFALMNTNEGPKGLAYIVS